MPSNRHNLTLDEQSFQSLLWAAFTIQEFNDRKFEGTVTVPAAKAAELFNSVPSPLLRELIQQALQATHANGAAIALKQQGELICRATAGDFASEIGAVINAGSGFTGLCISSGIMQLCNNTALDSRVDADACQKLGVSAIIVVPLVHQDQLLGVIAVFSRRPYAFGIRDLQALQDLAEKCVASLQLNAEPAN
jgi:L-methionine (R)-S-oxide reductase